MAKLFMLLVIAVASLNAAEPVHDQSAAKEAARECIKDHLLKAPATAIFSKETICAQTELVKLAGTQFEPAGLKVGTGDNMVIHRAFVDSQNSFGALLRTKFILMVGYDKGKWSVIDLTEAVNGLKAACSTKELHDDPLPCQAKGVAETP